MQRWLVHKKGQKGGQKSGRTSGREDGRADKRRMQLAIASRCRLEQPPEPADVADALAVAMCAAERLLGNQQILRAI